MNQCEFCKKKFKTDKGYARHVCVRKSRWISRDTFTSKMAYEFYLAWVKIGIPQLKKKPTFKDFIYSRYYVTFTKFSSYIYKVKVLNPEEFMRWCLNKRIKIDKWGTDSTYNKFLKDYNNRETAEKALERYVLHAEQWAIKNKEKWVDYWEKASNDRIIQDVSLGKVSPWVIFGYDRAKTRLAIMPSECLSAITDWIDLVHWNRKVETHKPTMKWIQETLP